jgi:hypothetical protein
LLKAYFILGAQVQDNKNPKAYLAIKSHGAMEKGHTHREMDYQENTKGFFSVGRK